MIAQINYPEIEESYLIHTLIILTKMKKNKPAFYKYSLDKPISVRINTN